MKKPTRLKRIARLLPVGLTIFGFYLNAFRYSTLFSQAIVLVLLFVGLASTLIAITGENTRQDRRNIAPTVSLILLLSMLFWNWPLHLCYQISRPAIEALMTRVRAGELISTPVRAGLYIVKDAGISHSGIPCLWTRPNPAGYTGFVQTDSPDDKFNLWSSTRVDDNCHFIQED
jgi:hypothetical protein